MDFNKFSRNVEIIYDWLPGSWQQSAFSGNRCTAQFPIPQVRVPSHSSSLSQSPSWIPHLLWIVQQFQELPLPLQVSWPLQSVASSHATTKDKKEHTIDLNFRKNSLKAHLDFILNFLSILSSLLWHTQKRSNLAKLQFFIMIKFAVKHKFWQNGQIWCFVNLSVFMVRDDLKGYRGNLTTKIGHKASKFSI